MTTKPAPLATRDWPNEIQDPVYFINDQWAVTGFGLERTTEEHPYEWNSERLLATHTNGPSQPVGSAVLCHIGQKTWVDATLLIEAFRIALAVHCEGEALPFDLDGEEGFLRAYKRGAP